MRPPAADWTLDSRGGLVFVGCGLLRRVPGVGHLFSTRAAPNRANLDARELLAAAGFHGVRPLALRQVHGNRVHLLDGAGDEGVEADASTADRERRGAYWPAVRTADCLPILIADRKGRRVAAVHAGWRGTAAGIVTRVVERMGGPPSSLVAAIGPGIGSCCYEVGPEVLRAVARVSGGGESVIEGRSAAGHRSLDLARANRLQLVAAGVAPDGISTAPWCTACEPSLFHSYRRDGEAAGRQIAAIGWPARRSA